jgi:Fe-S cluster assembly protein SufB
MELNTYFRINARNTGQFERTLIIADKDSKVSYLEGCTAPAYSQNTLHAACVELVAHENATIKYSTVQNWYPGDENGVGGVYNFVTKRGLCKGDNSKISWTQVETGSAITWKYPSCILRGDNSVGEFYSVAVTKGKQQADTGTKMFHVGKNTKSTIISKGISFDDSVNTYRGKVRVNKGATGSRNYTRCDSLMLDNSLAITLPTVEQHNNDSVVEHEASTNKVSEDQLYYLNTLGIDEENATNLIVNGFCKEVFKELPLEFAAEARQLLNVTLEGAVG